MIALPLQSIDDQPECCGPYSESDDMADMEMVSPIDGEHGKNGQDESTENAFAPDVESEKIHPARIA